ncbi:MAG: hypothetical protein IPK99_14675 [Flavobacteriales bacterium]|nr:hypothetical protein [Flavobacteriales bacterium]
MDRALCRSLFRTSALAPLPEGHGWTARANLAVDHPIFRGHFPGRPVTPGMAIVQLAQQLLSEGLSQELHLRTARAIKFLSPLEPATGTDLDIVLKITGAEGSNYTCDISGTCGGRAVFSLKGSFAPRT